MADPKPKKTQSPLYSGIVQMSFPAAGFCLVRQTGPTVIDKPLVCKLNTTGGLLGGGILQAPTAGTFVTYTVIPGSDKAYIVSTNPQGCEPQGYVQELRLSYVDDVVPMSSYTFVKGLLQKVQDTNKNKEHATANIGLQDQYEGDLYFGDRYGPGIFTGRAQLTIKGSQASYIQMASTEDKINVLTAKAQLDSFADKITISPNLTKVLKASGVLQGLGGRLSEPDKFPLTIEENTPSKLKYADEQQGPLFRSQTFEGGAVSGTHKTIISPTAGQPVVVASEMQSYDGQRMSFFAQGMCSIKTLAIPGLQDKPFEHLPQTEDGAKELEQRGMAADEIIQQVKKTKLSQNGFERALQLNKILQDDYEKALIAGMLGYKVLQLLEEGVEPFAGSLKAALQDWDRQGFQVGEFLSDGPKSADKNSYMENINRHANTSFITQDPDGSITIKDGWGSQITMSHGNIYISSALDTFIRPGRNLIGMIPQHMSLSTNGELQLAAKKNIKIGAEKNLQLASAISGEAGYTVLQNRSKQKGDMVIRSNGKLSITSSQDMHIGINDKRTNNAGKGVTPGDGSIFIEGNRVRIQSRGELRLLGQQTGIYACSTEGGTGFQFSTSSITVTAANFNLNTGLVKVGGFLSSGQLTFGPRGEYTTTLKGAQGDALLFVQGQALCKTLVVKDVIQAHGQIFGYGFRTFQPEDREKIEGTDPEKYKPIKDQIDEQFGTITYLRALSFDEKFQSWYDDDYICTKELTFIDQWLATEMPTMCWQLLPQTSDYDPLKSITVSATGKADKKTMAYPGSTGWQTCKMSVIDADYNVKYEGNLSTNYKTFTKGE